MAKEINNKSTKGTKRELTIHEKRFNLDVAEYLRSQLQGGHIYDILLRCNEIYAESFGYFPETDEVWISKLVLQNLKVLEMIAWEQFPEECTECKEMLMMMSTYELTAVKL